ncbi:hypothetical protein [Domibacillus tundrae]|uniref:hypothetical protein n=1 Tax=Domibacillus tundrae TaxID=1587527 RepID=UPI003391AC48
MDNTTPNITIYTINTSEGEKVAEKLAKYDLQDTIKYIVRDRFTYTEFKALLALTDDVLDDILTQAAAQSIS